MLHSPSPNEETIFKNTPNKSFNQKAIVKSLRYPALIGKNWQKLPSSIKNRLVSFPLSQDTKIYQGRIYQTRLSRTGYYLARGVQIIGQYLPKTNDTRGQAIVIVKELKKTNGQLWTRIYPGKGETFQVSQSFKQFSGPTGLEEILNNRIGIAFTVTTNKSCVNFTSDHYFILFGQKRFRLPSFLSPGEVKVEHKEKGPCKFRYSFSLTHSLFGQLIYQTAIFEEIH